MKNIFTILIMLSVTFTFAQEKQKSEVKKDGDLTIATYFYDNGEVSQEGTFNAEGKLHGTWTSYDTNGKKVTIGNYINGKKTGKWLFWSGNTLREVDFIDSKITTVNEWKNESTLAIRN
jgi:antitoxin component YwqK of YwqJK toxin-antitoxin module